MVSSTATTVQNTPLKVVVLGPTATGKTALGVALAKALQTDVISFDSQLVYRELAIGVAKPTEAERQGVVHHLMDWVDPTQRCSAGTFARKATRLLASFEAQQRPVVLVGGTGFYLRALFDPGHVPPVAINRNFRQAIADRLKACPDTDLHAELHRLDPVRAGQLHPNDTGRLIRALEIIAATGQPIPPLEADGSQNRWAMADDICLIGLRFADRTAHIRHIEARLQAMIEAGFLEETQAILNTYGHCQALQHAHGYPELVDVIEGRRTLSDAIEQIGINIRQYSRRQMTWFRSLPNVQWLDVDRHDPQTIVTIALETLHKRNKTPA